MQSTAKPGAILAGCLVTTLALTALALGGCMTARVKPQPSQAVLDARRAQDAKTQACAEITETPPIVATFSFQTAELSQAAKARLDEARHWLTCRPQLAARVEASSDQRGSARDQTALARQRRAAITAYLAGGGVQPARIREAQTDEAAQPAGADVVVIRGEGQGW